MNTAEEVARRLAQAMREEKRPGLTFDEYLDAVIANLEGDDEVV